MKAINILFDEFGTPTFEKDKETTAFGGIAVSYYERTEEEIFAKCDSLFSLSTKRPRKNRTLSKERAIRIADMVSTLPVGIVVNVVDLTNKEFRATAKVYERLSNAERTKHRKVREQPFAQYLHGRILDNCVLKCISNHAIQESIFESIYKIYVDNWAIKKADIEIFIELRADSLERNIQRLLTKLGTDTKIKVPPLSLLDVDSKRKRFIDILASVISRAFMDESHDRYSEVPLTRMRASSGSRFEFDDVTREEIRFMRSFEQRI